MSVGRRITRLVGSDLRAWHRSRTDHEQPGNNENGADVGIRKGTRSGSLDSFDFQNIARLGREEKPSFRARTVGEVSTVSTRNTAVFHPVLTFQLFRHA